MPISTTTIILSKLESLKENLSKTIIDVERKLQKPQISHATRTALESQLKDLRRSIYEINLLGSRLNRL